MAVDISTLFSALAVVVCLLLMARFIHYLGIMERIEVLSASSSPGLNIPSQSLVGTINPFSVEIPGRAASRQSIFEGLLVTLKCQVPCTVTCFWGVNIATLSRAVQNLLNLEPDEDYTDWNQGTVEDLLDGHYVSKKTVEIHCRNENYSLSCQPQKENIEYLQQLHEEQTVYPLVITMEMTSEVQHVLDQSYEVVALIVIIGFCPGQEHVTIIQQYIQTLDGKVFPVQKLFVAEGDVEMPHPSENRSEPLNHAVCVICQTESVTRALLPCRHACLCGSCFPRLTQCPMCRGIINSYFLVQEEPRYLDQEVGGLTQQLQQMSWWEIMRGILYAS